MPDDLEVVGSNPDSCWALLYLFSSSGKGQPDSSRSFLIKKGNNKGETSG